MNYYDIHFKTVQIDTIGIALREFGEGKNIFFIHGFPTHGYTWRKIVPKLYEKYKCNVVDLPGLGDSEWSDDTKFDSTSQALYILKLIEKMKVSKCHIVAHNSGATIARVLAIKRPDLVEKLVLINTEIPHHRPPWIPFYQKIGLLSPVPNIIRKILDKKWFIKSSMGFKQAYSNKLMFDNPDNLTPYLKPIVTSKKRTIGAFKYLKGIDWKVVDNFAENHKKIKAKTLFIWGEDDKTFPVELGKKMIHQFKSKVKFVVVPNSSLLPHEEKADEVAHKILSFLENE